MYKNIPDDITVSDCISDTDRQSPATIVDPTQNRTTSSVRTTTVTIDDRKQQSSVTTSSATHTVHSATSNSFESNSFMAATRPISVPFSAASNSRAQSSRVQVVSSQTGSFNAPVHSNDNLITSLSKTTQSRTATDTTVDLAFASIAMPAAALSSSKHTAVEPDLTNTNSIQHNNSNSFTKTNQVHTVESNSSSTAIQSSFWKVGTATHPSDDQDQHVAVQMADDAVPIQRKPIEIRAVSSKQPLDTSLDTPTDNSFNKNATLGSHFFNYINSSSSQLRNRSATPTAHVERKWNQGMWDAVIASTKDKNRGHKNLEQIRLDLIKLNLVDKPAVYIRNMRRTVVLFGHKTDSILMDTIWAWHLENLSANSIDAMNHFAGEKNADAIVKLLYSKSMSPWDSVIQFDVSEKKDSSLRISKEKVNELRTLHFTGMLRRGLILVFKVSELHPDVRFVKIVAPFGLLCKEAERIQLRMQLDLAKLITKPDSDEAKTPLIQNSVMSRMSQMIYARRQAKVQREIASLNSLTPDIVWEGPTSLFRDGTISPKRAAIFTRERLDSFCGGDISKLGLPYVHFHFFSNARRNMLVHSIVSACTINFSSNRSIRSNIDDLLLKKVYSAFYAVHDGPLLSAGSKVEHIEKTGELKTIVSETPSMRPLGMERNVRAELYQSLKDSYSIRYLFSYLPVNQLREYFGERIGFYFAWLGYYTIWCQSAAFFGIVTFVYGIYRSVSLPRSSIPDPNGSDTASEILIRAILLFDNEATPVYAFFMSIWAVLCLEFWKRQTQSIAFLWDVADYRKREKIRPQWCPSGTHISPITGKKENYESPRQKWTVRFITGSIVTLCILLILGFITGLIAFKEYFSSISSKTVTRSGSSIKRTIVDSLYAHLASFSVAIFAVIQILVIDPVYTYVARYLNDWDNYKTVSEYEDNLVLKGFLLSFLNNFSLIIHTAVIKALFRVYYEISQSPILDFGRWDGNCQIVSVKFGITNCMSDLIIQIATMFFFRQFFTQIVDTLWPLVSSRYSEIMSLNFDFDNNNEDSNTLSQYVRDSKLAETSDEQFAGEFSSKVIQFGYLTMFSAAFPLAPVLAYVNNLVEMRIDIWKFITIYQRPFARRESSIGRWESIMRSVVTIGVLTNALIIAFASSWFQRAFDLFFPAHLFLDPLQDENDPGQAQRTLIKVAVQLAFVLAFEHLVFLVAVFIDYLVPDIPQSVQLGQEAEEYLEQMQSAAHEERLEKNAKAAAEAATAAAMANAAKNSALAKAALLQAKLVEVSNQDPHFLQAQPVSTLAALDTTDNSIADDASTTSSATHG
ncbi:hypothetical protein O5D80_008520 [Batrachochytrium dendrobatidis]|nr:hypothetical protein O5D80_008520 [Batrachochytrium dendrobatidis]